MTRILTILMLIAVTAHAELGFVYDASKGWEYVSAGGNNYILRNPSATPSLIYTNSLHEINISAWSNSVAEYLFDDVNSLSWTNGTTGATNDTSYIGTNGLFNIGSTLFSSTNAGFTNFTYYFNADDYLYKTNYAHLNDTTQFTISAWVNLNKNDDWNPFLCIHYNNTNRLYFGTTGAGGIVPANSNDVWCGFFKNGVNGAMTTTNHPIVYSSWHNYATVFDGTQSGNTNRLKIYIDGILQNQVSYGTFTINDMTGTNMGTLRVGLDIAGADNYAIQMSLDTIYVLKEKALSSNEVFSTYNSTKYRYGL